MAEKCKRCRYVWLPIGSREIPKTGNLYMADLGLCMNCDNHTVRVRVASPGDQANAMLWGRRLETVRRERGS